MKKTVMNVALVIAMALPGAAFAAAWKTADTKAGEVYTDASGMSLYTFRKDKPGKSKCFGACAAAWPPFIAAAGASDSGDWTLVKRKNGAMQWAYKDAPLYLWAGDKKAGDVSGDGVGGVWDLARPGLKAKSSKKVNQSDY